MTEKIASDFHNTATTEQVSKWLAHDISLIQNRAGILDGHFNPTREQRDAMHAEMEAARSAQRERASSKSGTLALGQVIAETQPASYAEQGDSSEKIVDWVQTGVIKVTTWLGQNNILQEYNPARRSNAYTDLINKRGALKIKIAPIAPTHKRQFAAQGVSEIVTIHPLRETFSAYDKDSSHAIEKAVQISYQTVSGSGTPYKHNDKVTGNSLSVGMVLPESRVQEFEQVVHENPSIMRELAEVVMTERINAGESWEAARPPYEEWKQFNGGVNRIALRHSVIETPEQSQVLTYS